MKCVNDQFNAFEAEYLLNKILIANRGEIAVRIARACAEMGIKSVAVYAEADRNALHVKKADEAYSLGPDNIAGYLNAHRLVNMAVETGCDALHPGYGFLSENPELAEICARRGIRFIGPTSDVIRSMGDKIEARTAMIKAGIPVTPGSEGNLKNVSEAKKNSPGASVTRLCSRQPPEAVGAVSAAVRMKKISAKTTTE